MLKIELKDAKKWNGRGETLAVFVHEEEVPAAAKADGFKGKEQTSFLSRRADANPAERVILVGLGKKGEISDETLRRAGAKALHACEALGLESVAVQVPKVGGAD